MQPTPLGSRHYLLCTVYCVLRTAYTPSAFACPPMGHGDPVSGDQNELPIPSVWLGAVARKVSVQPYRGAPSRDRADQQQTVCTSVCD